MVTASEINKSIEDLKNPNRAIREHARYTLIEARHEALPALLELLKSDKVHARWEAANILKRIGDPDAADALVDALLDNSIEVHWQASEALIALGYHSVLPVLKGIIRHFESYRFRQGAYHILHTFERFSSLDHETQSVLDALRDIEPSVKAPWAAERAIEALEIFRKK
jgi:HEAT repeat protein